MSASFANQQLMSIAPGRPIINGAERQQRELAAFAGYALRENRYKRRNIIIWQLARLRRLKATKVPTGRQLARIEQLEQDTASGFYGLSLYA